MIKKIYQLADIHIPTYQKLEMYATQLEKTVQLIAQDAEASGLQRDEMRIVICGDLVNSKNTVTNELNVFVSSFIRELANICKVLVIAGNHDLIESNTSRTDTLTAIFQTAKFDPNDAVFIDMSLDYESGALIDDNVIWALYSIYDDFKGPNIEPLKKSYPDKQIIGLFHGLIVGCKLFNGFVGDSGCDNSLFDGCDVVMAGHIHKRQIIEGNDCKIVYVGSTVQKNFGESLTQHGFAVWNVPSLECTFIDVPSEYGYFDMTINNFDDFKEDKEILNNY